MKSFALLPAGLLLWFASNAASYAALPEATQVVQAESMTLTGSGWTVREHSAEQWYTGRPVGQMLGGQNDQLGTATTTLHIPTAGTYRIWVRYLDMVTYRSQSAFKLSASQQDEQVFDFEFDSAEASPRSTPQGADKWGAGFACWIWDFVEFEATPGEMQLVLQKLHPAAVHDCTRTLDVLLLTADLDYEPVVTDLAPLYVKIRMLPEQTQPVVIHFWGRRSFSPWYTPHANINQQGISVGVSDGSEDKADIRMAAGEESGWIDIAPYLAYGGLNQISLYAMRSYYEPESEAYFEVFFSKTPSELGLIQQAERKGPGDGLIFAVDLVDYQLVTEIDGSQSSLEMAHAAPVVAGQIPTEFPFFTSMTLDEKRSTTEAVRREREALRLIGIGNVKQRPANYFFHLTKTPGCLSQPDRQRIDDSMQAFANTHPDRDGWQMLNLMDEPGFDFAHVEHCPDCQAGFTAYLRQLGLSDGEAAQLRINNDPERASPGETSLAAKKSYYYTRRYMNHVMTEMLRAGSESAQKYMPGVPTTANFACELIAGNLVSGCVDWYEIFASGALTYGWNEDWGGWARTRQVNGYYVDVMRSACRQPNINFGIYNVLARPAWEIQARGFLEIGHGVKAISFFNYGPYYAISSDTNSQRPEIYEAIKRLTFPAGAVETDIMSAATAPGDVAQLLSVTGDIWYATRDNVFGQERAWLNLLLRHCNVRCDILSEDDLPARLANYKMLFVTDANLKRSAVPYLVKWVREGGILYVGAGALVRDEFDAPLELDDALQLHREPLELQQNPGRSEYEMQTLNTLGVYQGIKQFCGTQAPNFQTLPAGSGKVMAVGFFPAISYIATSERPAGAEYSTLDFDPVHRDWMHKILTAGNIRPRLRTDNYRVEANWLQAPAADLIAISNWTGQEQTIVLELEDAPAYRDIRSVTGRIIATDNADGILRVQLRVAAGDLIQLRK